MAGDHPFHVGENGRGPIDQARHVGAERRREFGLQIAFHRRHAAAHEMEAQAHLAHGLDLRIDESAVAIRHEVEMVDARRGTGQQQFGRRRAAGRDMIVRGHHPPDGIEQPQPIEEMAARRARHGARQRLEEMVMRVDESGHGDRAAEVDALVEIAARRRPLAQRRDDPAVDDEPGPAQDAIGVVAGVKRVDVLDDAAHAQAPR